MPYLYSLPSTASFTSKGLLGYTFGPLRQQDLEIYYIDVSKGHDTFMVSKTITRTYYVLSGNGYFTIDNQQYPVAPGMLVEVPPKVEYSYSGSMILLGLSRPRWFVGNDTFTKWNPDVVSVGTPFAIEGGASWLEKLVMVRLFNRSPLNFYLRINQRLWDMLPSPYTRMQLLRSYGNLLHRLACMRNDRAQALSTFFLRNRPALKLLRKLLDHSGTGDELKVAVLGCSIGAEAYSISWRIRSARPDLKLSLHGVDVSKQAVDFAQRGVYSLTTRDLAPTSLFECMSAAEMEELFDRDGDTMTVKPWIKDGINWHVHDVGDNELLDLLGSQDIVVANNFLCHMKSPDAERCLRDLARLVKPHGYLMVSGIDLDVRTKVALDLGWTPLDTLLEELHEGDPYLRRQWPCHYGGLEPLDRNKADWTIRYAAAFQMPPLSDSLSRPTAVAGRTAEKMSV